MSIFGSKKNYASIVAPLKKMADDLSTYISEQNQRITNLEVQRAQIDASIAESNSEIAKSNFTTTKINELIAADLDEDGTADVDELPIDSTSEEDTIQ